MTVSLYIAPAGSGKTDYVLRLVREAAHDLRACPRVCVANQQQLASWQQRLAAAGGCIGAHLITFDDLYAECLIQSREAYTQIGDVVEYRLLRAIVSRLSPTYYEALQNFPGFIQECQRLILELKSSKISPAVFKEAVHQIGDAPRLREIGEIYAAYQDYLRQNRLADYRGLGWLALDALARPENAVGRDWKLLVLDGFASFTQVQLALLRALQPRVDEIVITLSGDLQAAQPRSCHRHYARSRAAIESALSVQAADLPTRAYRPPDPFSTLEANLFSRRWHTPAEAAPAPPSDAIQLISAPDHAGEVRVALRWLKQRIVEDSIAPHETALAARNIEPYRSFILLTAKEYGLPIHFVEGVPLQQNPAVAALLALLQILLPLRGGVAYQPTWPRRALINTLRAPYFDWHSLATPALQAEDVDRLDAVGRWGQVIGGADQWWESLQRLASIQPAALERGYDDELGKLPTDLPYGQDARELMAKMDAILRALAPPQGKNPASTFVAWLDNLIGPDVVEAHATAEGSLNLLARVRQAEPELRDRDICALRRLKDVLRSLYWSELVELDDGAVDYAAFLDELLGSIEADSYHPGAAHPDQAILVSNVVAGRGVPCRALALLGMAEGLFPATLREEPFLRESDREQLRTSYSLPLDSALDSHEQEYFYETIARANEWLLLTRPDQSESGGEWAPSSFWTEVQRTTGVKAHSGGVDGSLPASVVEYLFRLCERFGAFPEEMQGEQRLFRRWQQVEEGAAIFGARWSAAGSPFAGSLSRLAQHLQDQFGAGRLWSPSRLETYLNCPLHFFLSHLLGIESRAEPEDGLDARQLGNLYHRLLEATYDRLPPKKRMDLAAVLASFEVIAGPILDEAPLREGFRETGWWRETKAEIRANVRESLANLAGLGGAFVPMHFEQFFSQEQPLVLERDGEQIRVRGIIDRIDVDDQGRVRLIDYKTAGKSSYGNSAHREGKRLQLPLYARAAQEALGLGEVVDGFYWHVQQAEPSDFSLQKTGVHDAVEAAIDHAWRAVDGVRHGHFVPSPPPEGCPTYCPGAAFCWRYEPRHS